MERYLVDFESMPWETSAAGVRFKAHEQNGKRLRLVEFTREFVELDWCANGHIGLILEGQIEVDFDGEIIIFSAGEGVFIPSGENHKHKGRALTDIVRLVLVEDMGDGV